ncbi:MAG: alanine racemase, partial [Pseudomonadota bacterium]
MRRAPAQIGDPVDAVWTPALIVDLDAFDANIRSLASFASAHGVGLRPHAKTHKSADISKIQMAHGAIGVCCQKLSEAEALVAGGVSDVLISNEVVGERRLDELAGLAGKARMLVCVDDPATLAAMSRACVRHGTTLEVLVEIDVGQGRCGVAPGHEALVLAQSIDAL